MINPAWFRGLRGQVAMLVDDLRRQSDAGQDLSAWLRAQYRMAAGRRPGDTDEAAAGLLDFWRSGSGVCDFTDPDLDTSFLGGLYQDLSAEARKRHALVQTPDFVADLILDLTLTSAIEEFGYDKISLIDPVC